MDETPRIIVDLREHCVWSDGESIALRQKAFDLLAFFLRNPGRLLTKAAILRGVWPDTHVTEGSVKDVVKQLRNVLHDDPANLRYIETERGGWATATWAAYRCSRSPKRKIRDPNLCTRISPKAT